MRLGWVCNAYSLLEHGNFFIGQSVSFRHHWNQVDLGVQSSHNFNVEGLQ